jgi:hypothetical protein
MTLTLAQFIGCVLAIYTAAGLCTALAFVTLGPERTLRSPASFTPGARLLLLPGAFALWPWVLARLFENRKR